MSNYSFKTILLPAHGAVLYFHIHTHKHSPQSVQTLTVNFPISNFPIIHRKWFLSHHQSQVAMGNMVFPYHLFIVFIFILFLSLVCLFP